MNYAMRAWRATPVGEDAEGSELIWIAGHNAAREGAGLADAGAQAESFGAQFALSMERLEKTLHEAGASWSDIVSARLSVPAPEDLPELEALLSTWKREFESGREPMPALSVGCGALRPGLRFEIECVAVRPGPNLHVGG